ncbi:MAG: glycosyltransferase [Planctomycetes bacterium]|nr:glycosyltransferase [Planctomycetota bacterium]
MTAPEVSVVIPFFEEEANVAPLFEELLPILDGMGLGFEVVGVDDGSTDATRARLYEVAARRDEVRVLHFEKNHGQTAAFEAGFAAARGRWIVTMDGDLQIDPADVPRMLAYCDERGVDFVYGWRKDRKDNFVKRASTRIANAVRNFLTHERITDTGCPLKVFRAEILHRMKLFNGMHRFLITLAHMDGWTSAEMVVAHRHRQHGRSKYGVMNRVFRALRDCFSVRWMMKRHLRYDVAESPASATGDEPGGGDRGSEAAES